jgi:hypothetical protein
MKIPLRAWAFLGGLLQILLVLNVLGFNVVLLVVRFEQLLFFFGLALSVYSFLAWLSGLGAWFSQHAAKESKSLGAWERLFGGEKKT